MKRLHRYILYNFLSVFVFSLIFMVLLFYLSDFFGHLSSFLKNSVGVYVIAKYYFYYTPFILYYLSPLIFAISSLVTLGFMSMRNEIIVMRASGINIFEIAYPLLVLSFLFGILMFFSNEYVVAKSLDRAYFIKKFEFDKNSVSDIWMKKGNLFINAKSIGLKSKTAYGIKIYKVVNNDIKEVISAKNMELKKSDVLVNDATIVNMKNPAVKEKKKSIYLKIKVRESDFVKSPQRSDYTLKEVWNSMKKVKNRRFYASIFMSKLFYPLSTIILTLLSLVFVLKTTPRKSDFVKNVFLGAISFIIYVGIFELLVSMGKMSMIQPVLTIALFMLLWLVFSVYNLLKLGV